MRTDSEVLIPDAKEFIATPPFLISESSRKGRISDT
jgi:hypothetical protein